MNSEVDTLRGLRIANHYTQDTLSKKVGVEQAAISHWELGRAIPNRKNRKKLARLLKVPVERIDMIFERAND